MKTILVFVGMILSSAAALAPVLLAQDGRGGGGGRGGILAHNPANDNKPYDKHDLGGIWSRNGSPGGYGGGGTCRDCGDRGYSNDVPPFTALGQKMFDANKPSYGRILGSADAAAHSETDPFTRTTPDMMFSATLHPAFPWTVISPCWFMPPRK